MKMPDAEFYNTFTVPLIRGDWDDRLDYIISAAKERKDRLAPKVWDFEIGEKVRLNETVRPKYLAGSEAVIQKINRTKVVIDLVKPQGRFYTGISAPTSMLTKVG
jgi:hypothetical protein